MNFFEVIPDQVTRLDADGLVELLRRLIIAELKKFKIPVSSGKAPAQINIPDGGEDGRVSWRGRVNETDYLPSRFVVFQCKKSDPGPAGLKKEVFSKKTAKLKDGKELNEAISKAIECSGAYVVVTADPVVGTKMDDRVKAIKSCIEEAGEDPSLLSAIEIYDSNALSNWANFHPAVALWLNEKLKDVSLNGFRHFEDWSSDRDMSEIGFQITKDARFQISENSYTALKRDNSELRSENDFVSMRHVVANCFANDVLALRVVGPSGYGKTRFVNELYRSALAEELEYLDKSQVVYVAYDGAPSSLVSIVREVSQSKSLVTFIVDDCPDDIHKKLLTAVDRKGSNCRIITIGSDTATDGTEKNVVLRITKASDELVDSIVASVVSDQSYSERDTIRVLADGFPSMAILAAREIGRMMPGDRIAMFSVDSLLSRIIWGDYPADPQALDTLQLLSFFTVLGIDREAGSELDQIAAFAERRKNDLYSDIAKFSKRGLISRIGDFAEVQPLPLAMRLMRQRLEERPSDFLWVFFSSVSPKMQMKMVKRLRWISGLEVVDSFCNSVLNQCLGAKEILNTEIGAKLFDRLVHLSPDRAMNHVDRLLGGLSIDELTTFRQGRRYIVWALGKLVFRKETFDPAARLLLKLAAAETENFSNNATGEFLCLYQLYLSGTEAVPDAKIAVLDEGLSSRDERVRRICVEALARMLRVGHFSRSGGNEKIGSEVPRKDWAPKTYREQFDYHRASLTRLEKIASNKADEFASQALKAIADSMRGMLGVRTLFDDVASIICRLRNLWPSWFSFQKGVSSWLFFDSKKAPADYRDRVRALYDKILPSDPIDLVLLYSSGRGNDFPDPDVPYDGEKSTDFEYSGRIISELVAASPNCSEYFSPILNEFRKNIYPNYFFSMSSIARHVSDPEKLVSQICQFASHGAGADLCAKLTCSVVFGVYSVNQEKAKKCIDIALRCEQLEPYMISIISSVEIDNALFNKMLAAVSEDRVELGGVESISSPEKLKKISLSKILDLLNVMMFKGAVGAWATICFLGRYVGGQNDINDAFVDVLKKSVTNKILFLDHNFDEMGVFFWKSIVKYIIMLGAFDKDFARDLTKFVFSIDDYLICFYFEDNARDVMFELIYHHPDVFWECFLFEINQDDEMSFILDCLISGRDDFGDSYSLLGFIPKEIYLPWVLEKKEKRLNKILDWIKLFERDGEEKRWNKDLILLVNEHIDHPSQMNVIGFRLKYGSWSGSYANRLEQVIDKLQEFGELTNNPIVGPWIASCCDDLQCEIKDERHKDENIEASYRE